MKSVNAISTQAAEMQILRSCKRWSLALLLMACFAGSVSTGALAAQHNYFGFDNLTASNPSAPNCGGVFNFLSGYACYGLNYNDYNQVQWNSGRSAFRFGFTSCYGCGYENRLMSGSEAFSTYTVIWSQFTVAHYNYAVCSHTDGGSNTYNYLQCRALVYP